MRQQNQPLNTILKQGARSWWYHVELRKNGNHSEARRREHQSVRSSISSLRETISNGGYLSLGRGGYTLHCSAHSTVSGYGCDTSATVRAAKHLGIPCIDTRTIPDSRIYDTISLPMVALSPDEADPRPWGSLSRAPLPVVAYLYRALGATVTGIDCEMPSPDDFRGNKQWEVDAMRGFANGDAALLGSAMIASRDDSNAA